MHRLLQTHLRGLKAYVPGEQPGESGWVKLNTNELPFPPPPQVEKAIRAETGKIARYPNPRSQPLREALAAKHGLQPERVIVGNGSDDLLNLLARAYGGTGRNTLQTFPSYSLYPVITAISGGTIGSVYFNDDFALPVEELLQQNSDLLFLTCPNAPSGISFPLDGLRSLARAHKGLLVIDEAYVEFASQSALALLEEFSNVVLTRTFSKAYGLAGLRVGYALASSEVIQDLDKIRDSYNVNRLSQAGALAALQADEHYRNCIEKILTTRDWLRQALMDRGWFAYPSESNFLFAAPVRPGFPDKSPELAADLYQWLFKHQILVRYFPNHPLTAPFLRITIGTQSEMEKFLTRIEEWTNHA